MIFSLVLIMTLALSEMCAVQDLTFQRYCILMLVTETECCLGSNGTFSI